ncbi:MAG: hypothetical protein BM555_07030 [Crocinitomix sp. MedPE-SWsnd]|nr:MAG: hypothetical protein BM555_07030 [Crocinitomix sp. MedPE-SWsnd]
MKLLLLFISLGMFSLAGLSQDQEIDSSEDEVIVKDAVVHWADSVFYSHEKYKFENFRAFYTEEYFIQVMRSRMYKERVTDLEKSKKLGRYKKSDAEYEKEHKELEDAYNKVQKDVDTFKFRASYYQVSFWSNIQTNDGITVYYEHIVKLNNDYKVTEAVINSSIGKKSDKTEILYSTDVKGGKKKSKQK